MLSEQTWVRIPSCRIGISWQCSLGSEPGKSKLRIFEHIFCLAHVTHCSTIEHWHSFIIPLPLHYVQVWGCLGLIVQMFPMFCGPQGPLQKTCQKYGNLIFLSFEITKNQTRSTSERGFGCYARTNFSKAWCQLCVLGVIRVWLLSPATRNFRAQEG